MCPDCGGKAKRYDKVKRKVKSRDGKESFIFVERYRCTICNKIHRVLPDDLLPYKQYEKDIIEGVLEGHITNETLGFEDYPCDLTMSNWKREFSTDFFFTKSGF